MPKTPISQALFEIRKKRMTMGHNRFAKRIGYAGGSSYQRFEQDYAEPYLPPELIERLLTLVGSGVPPITREEILRLGPTFDDSPHDLRSEDIAGGYDGAEAGIPYGGIVEAGTFRRVDLLDQSRETRLIPIEPDSRYSRARQYAYEIQGDSMNERKLLPGMWALAADYHDYHEHYGDVRDGYCVIVRQSRAGGQEIELTIKEIRIYRDRIELVPRSSNKEHQKMIIPNDRAADHHHVEIIGVVLKAFQTLL